MLPQRKLQQPAVLPMSREEMATLGWTHLDILLVSGDAYVDHPSFGVALLGRLLVAQGFRVGIVAQPLWLDKQQAVQSLQKMGRPRLFVGVTAGAIDSMLAHYTAFRKKRHDDAYTPGGEAGARPNRACIVYTGLVRQAFPHMPVVLGGIEASLRKSVHYDFWVDAIRRPLLADSKADLLVYGMGEQALVNIAHIAHNIVQGVGNGATDSKNVERALQKAVHGAEEREEQHTPLFRQALVQACKNIKGIVFSHSLTKAAEHTAYLAEQGVLVHTMPDFASIVAEPKKLMIATLAFEEYTHTGATVVTQQADEAVFFFTPPAPLLTEQAMDTLYSLPFSRLPHPEYTKAIPAWEMIRTSITTHRGCGGGCSFCSLALHQGRRIGSRSAHSIITEASIIAKGPFPNQKPPRWAGAISDVGGPSANMWRATCTSPTMCLRKSCMHPRICPFFRVNQKEGVALLRALQKLPDINHVRIASGVRFDLALQSKEALVAYTSEFTGGQLKVAPEHSVAEVLNLMRKPNLPVFEDFLTAFTKACGQAGKEQYTVAYLMSAFPGCTMENMQALHEWLQKKRWKPEQVQCFIPTPGTVATAMFYAEVDSSLEPLYVAKSDKERLEQHYILVTPLHRSKRLDTSGSSHHNGKRTWAKDARTKAKSGQKQGMKQQHEMKQEQREDTDNRTKRGQKPENKFGAKPEQNGKNTRQKESALSKKHERTSGKNNNEGKKSHQPRNQNKSKKRS